jgi:Fe2+ transport system protein FeoA
MEGRCFFEDAVKQKLRVLGILPKAPKECLRRTPLADFEE